MIRIPETAAEIEALLTKLERDQMRDQLAMEGELAKLQEDFGVTTVEEGRDLHATLLRKLTKDEAALAKSREAFEKKWKDHLDV